MLERLEHVDLPKPPQRAGIKAPGSGSTEEGAAHMLGSTQSEQQAAGSAQDKGQRHAFVGRTQESV